MLSLSLGLSSPEAMGSVTYWPLNSGMFLKDLFCLGLTPKAKADDKMLALRRFEPSSFDPLGRYDSEELEISLAVPLWCGTQAPALPSRAAESRRSKVETSEVLRGEVRLSDTIPRTMPQGLQGLVQKYDEGGVMHTLWCLSAQKLRGKDRTIISPPFQLFEGSKASFKIMLAARGMAKKGACFKQAEVQLKCEDVIEERRGGAAELRIRIENDGPEAQVQRGTASYDFGQRTVCTIPSNSGATGREFTMCADGATHFVVDLTAVQMQ